MTPLLSLQPQDKKFLLLGIHSALPLAIVAGLTALLASVQPVISKLEHPLQCSLPPVLKASLSIKLILYFAGILVHKCYPEMNKSFQLCWVAIARGLKADGLIRTENLASDFPKVSKVGSAGSLAGKCQHKTSNPVIEKKVTYIHT